MRADFGDRVVAIVLDVTKNDSLKDWHERANAYLHHLEHDASDEAVIVSASDKIHNLLSILTDHEACGEELWQRFSTKSSADQLWWYESILGVISRRNVPVILSAELAKQLETLEARLATI